MPGTDKTLPLTGRAAVVREHRTGARRPGMHGRPPGTRPCMDPSPGDAGSHPVRRPEPDTRPAAAAAPPPRSRRALAVFVSSLVLVVCAVAGVLLFFTDQPVGYPVLLLGLAALAAAALVVTLRRGARR
ncbi:hypothetical protein [Blastococcus tunisiensis]|nr:hypothetical protein [Blastococcus sp. DSM 46838]